MGRPTILGVRVNDEERALITQLAAHEERSLSDVVRRLLRDRARELGLLPSGMIEGCPRLSQQSTLRDA